MANVNTKTYVDIHTTGKRHEFGSIREYDKFLKAHNSYVVSQRDLKKLEQPPSPPKTDYKKLAETAWHEREKFVQDIKYKRRKLGGY